MPCLEFSLETTPEAIDWVRTLLAQTDYTSEISVSAAEDLVSEAWAFTLRFYVAYDAQANSRVSEIERLLSPLSRTGLTSELDVCVVEAQPKITTSIHRIGSRFVVLTPEENYPAKDPEIVLKLARSFAFGSGLHPATALSLELLEKYVDPSMQVLDLGSGSGILSIAIAKLGATVLALDNDAIAVAATKTAVEQNHVSDRVTVTQGSLGQGSELGHWMSGESLLDVSAIEPSANFDLIAANILGRIHLSLIDEYRRALRPAGILVMAGFTSEYAEELAIALTQTGFEKIDEARSGEWVALAYRL